MIYHGTYLTTIFQARNSPQLLCLKSELEAYKRGEIWQVQAGNLCRITPSFLITRKNGRSGTWQVLEEKSLEEQIQELLG